MSVGYLDAIVAVSLFLVVYHFLLYPGIIIALARLGRAGRQAEASVPLPRITMVIAAYNEERVIADKLGNTLAIDYPPELLQVIVVSDGSNDGTAAIAGGFDPQRVVSMHHPDRRGKTAALNRAAERAGGEIIVFSDANNDFSPNALRELVKHFSDPAVGGVCGVKRIKPASDRQATVGDGLYWKYESAIKLAEGRVRTITNADGEIFAIRRALYRALDERIINDDAQITIDIVQKGFRVLYEPAAESREYASISVRDDFFVKVRMVAGGFQTVVENWRVLFPPLTWFAFTFLSHKVLRWLIPELLIALFVATIALSSTPLYQVLLIAQLAFYATAFYGWGQTKKGRELPTLIYVPFYFCAMNLAALFGLYRYASGWKTQHWRKAQR